jgi:hypothetical protein
MSNNPNIRTATFFNITLPYYEGANVPEAFLKIVKGLRHPSEEVDENGEPIPGEVMTSENATIKQAIEAARKIKHIDVDPPIFIEHIEGVKPLRDSDNPTHAIIGMRNVGGDMDVESMNLANAEGRPYSHVKMSHKQALTYLNDGVLP